MKFRDLAWLVGLLEGEGSFGLNPTKGKHYARISLGMVDRDVVARAAHLMEVRLLGPYGPYSANRQAFYEAHVDGLAAKKMMRTLLPFMGKRRKAQICRVLTLAR